MDIGLKLCVIHLISTLLKGRNMRNHWKCPYCSNHSVIDGHSRSNGRMDFNNSNRLGALILTTQSITCKNPACREFTISAALSYAKPSFIGQTAEVGETIQAWTLKPQSLAKPLPDYIPQAIRKDYEEACSIASLSPKASATLARRCLQGMIRDFWGVSGKRNLFEEINAIEDKIDSSVWKAIDAVRTIGNIGAHMEKDINIIVEVEKDEADLLIQLIELLLEEWYINRHQREQRLASIEEIGIGKQLERKPDLE